jgi:hypothetical protein
MFEKRSKNDDNTIISEKARCFIGTTGVEPLATGLWEVITRTFTIRADKSYGKTSFSENEILQRILNYRDRLLSAIFIKTHRVLNLLEKGIHKEIANKLGQHQKNRCNEYLALMFLMLNSRKENDIHAELQKLQSWLKIINAESSLSFQGSDPIVTAILSLINMFITSKKYQREGDLFIRFPLTFISENGHYGFEGGAASIFTSLSKYAKECNIRFPFSSAQQFIQRLSMSIIGLKEARVEVSTVALRSRKTVYTFLFDPEIF